LIAPVDALLIDSTLLYFMAHVLKIERTHFYINVIHARTDPKKCQKAAK